MFYIDTNEIGDEFSKSSHGGMCTGFSYALNVMSHLFFHSINEWARTIMNPSKSTTSRKIFFLSTEI